MPIQLDSHPKTSELHLWADYAELLCLFDKDRILSKAEFEDNVEDGIDLGETEFIEDDPELTPAEYNDEFSQKTDDVFLHLAYRQETFGDFYPFYLDDYRQLCLKTELSKPTRFYILLLLASNLGRLKSEDGTDDITHRHDITNSFEVICAEAVRRMLPEGAQVHIFGPRHGGRYTGNIWTKVNLLASDLSESLKVPESDFSKHSTGDEGLDIVAWLPTGDQNSGRLLLFAQCACTLEWKDKQYSSSTVNWGQIMTFKSSPTNLSFIPFQFRHADGTWYVTKDIKAFLIDRQRLVHLLKSDICGIFSLPGLDYVDHIIGNTELEG